MSIAHVTEQPPYWYHRFSIESRVKERRKHHQKIKHHPCIHPSPDPVEVDVKNFCCAGAPNGPLAVPLQYNALAITIGLLSAMATKLCPQTCPQPNLMPLTHVPGRCSGTPSFENKSYSPVSPHQCIPCHFCQNQKFKALASIGIGGLRLRK